MALQSGWRNIGRYWQPPPAHSRNVALKLPPNGCCLPSADCPLRLR